MMRISKLTLSVALLAGGGALKGCGGVPTGGSDMLEEPKTSLHSSISSAGLAVPSGLLGDVVASFRNRPMAAAPSGHSTASLTSPLSSGDSQWPSHLTTSSGAETSTPPELPPLTWPLPKVVKERHLNHWLLTAWLRDPGHPEDIDDAQKFISRAIDMAALDQRRSKGKRDQLLSRPPRAFYKTAPLSHLATAMRRLRRDRAERKLVVKPPESISTASPKEHRGEKPSPDLPQVKKGLIRTMQAQGPSVPSPLNGICEPSEVEALAQEYYKQGRARQKGPVTDSEGRYAMAYLRRRIRAAAYAQRGKQVQGQPHLTLRQALQKPHPFQALDLSQMAKKEAKRRSA